MSSIISYNNSIYSSSQNSIFQYSTEGLFEDAVFHFDSLFHEKDASNYVSKLNNRVKDKYHALQNTQTSKPLYEENILNGYPGLRFNGINQFLQIDFDTDVSRAQPTTYFAVFSQNRLDTSGGQTSVLLGGDSNAGQSLADINNGFGYYAGSTWKTYTKTINPACFSVVLYGGSSYIRENGVLKLSGQNPGIADQSLTMFLGKFIYGSSHIHGHIDLFSVIMFDKILTQEKIDKIENYLIQKYAL